MTTPVADKPAAPLPVAAPAAPPDKVAGQPKASATPIKRGNWADDIAALKAAEIGVTTAEKTRRVASSPTSAQNGNPLYDARNGAKSANENYGHAYAKVQQDFEQELRARFAEIDTSHYLTQGLYRQAAEKIADDIVKEHGVIPKLSWDHRIDSGYNLLNDIAASAVATVVDKAPSGVELDEARSKA